jgi:hypothetical protein
LTPSERAFLRFIEGAVCTAIVAAVTTIYQGLNQHLDWHTTLYAALAAGGTALLLTFNKYLRAHLDPTLDDLVTRLEAIWNLPTDTSAPPGSAS